MNRVLDSVVISALYRAGLTEHAIRKGLSLSNSQAFKNCVPQAPQPKGGDAYAAQLRLHHETREPRRHFSKAQRKAIAGVLYEHLKLRSVLDYANALDDLLTRLRRQELPQAAPEFGYALFINVTFGRMMRVDSWGNFLMSCSAENNYPRSRDELLERLIVFCDTKYRPEVVPAWPNDGVEIIERMLNTLLEQEGDVLRSHFGLGREKETLEQIGLRYGKTRERIRQIEAKGVRKLRHPSRSRVLRAVFLARHGPSKEQLEQLFPMAEGRQPEY